MSDKVFTILEFNDAVDKLLQKRVANVMIEGEISKITVQATSGHIYFTIKDESASLDCVMFRYIATRLDFMPQIGDKIIVTGNANLYPKTGRFQFLVAAIKKSGIGNLLEIIEKNKKLWANTYFKREKRPLSKFIKTIAVITSPTGAVIHDIIRVRNKRDKSVNIVVIPAVMQGDTCVKSVVDAIEKANKMQKEGTLNADVLIVARGGGSFEDLYPFNDEKIVKALSESQMICISAIGHDTDNPLCDYAADIRAATPTQAAELSITDKSVIEEYILNSSKSLDNHIKNKMNNAILQNDNAINTLNFLLNKKISDASLKLENSLKLLKTNFLHFLEQKYNNVQKKVQLLEALSPYSILERGYAVAFDENKKVIKVPNDIKIGSTFDLKLKDGFIKAKREN